MNETDLFSISEELGTKESAPYIELAYRDGDDMGGEIEITIRKYPKRVFVAYRVDSDVYQGDDNMDVFLAPSYITEKTLHSDFDLLKSLERVCKIKDVYGDEGGEMSQYIYERCFKSWNAIMRCNISEARELLNQEVSG